MKITMLLLREVKILDKYLTFYSHLLAISQDGFYFISLIARIMTKWLRRRVDMKQKSPVGMN